MKPKFRCNCPVTTFLDLFGDRWTLVILKFMLLEGKKTFKEFMESDEGIATNILSDRLKILEDQGFLEKNPHPESKKSHYYHLTEKGLSLSPIIVDMAIWAHRHLRSDRPGLAKLPAAESMMADRDHFIHDVIKNYTETYDDDHDDDLAKAHDEATR